MFADSTGFNWIARVSRAILAWQYVVWLAQRPKTCDKIWYLWPLRKDPCQLLQDSLCSHKKRIVKRACESWIFLLSVRYEMIRVLGCRSWLVDVLKLALLDILGSLHILCLVNCVCRLHWFQLNLSNIWIFLHWFPSTSSTGGGKFKCWSKCRAVLYIILLLPVGSFPISNPKEGHCECPEKTNQLQAGWPGSELAKEVDALPGCIVVSKTLLSY